MNIFVGNLSFEATEGDVKKLFEGFGNVASVAIVMRKEKKAPKSRGFGFVQMPDEQQALAAIAVLNGKEFMGRVLDVNPARLNPTGIGLPVHYNNKHPALKAPRPNGRAGTPPSAVERRVRPSGQHLALLDGKCAPSGQPGTYKGGRRTHSYMKRQGLAGMQEEAKPWRGNQDNPMRWRKRKDQAKPWQKSPGKHKPWKKTEGEARPWKKPAGDAKPWKKPAGDAKPWKKPAGDAKPWSKSNGRPQKSRFKGRKNPDGYKR